MSSLRKHQLQKLFRAKLAEFAKTLDERDEDILRNRILSETPLPWTTSAPNTPSPKSEPGNWKPASSSGYATTSRKTLKISTTCEHSVADYQ